MCQCVIITLPYTRGEWRTDENACLAFSGGALRSLLSCYALFRTFLAPFLTGTADVSIYFATFPLFFIFCLLFSPLAYRPRSGIAYLRSADAHNGCTKVTEFAGVQRTMWVRVGLRSRALQTIAGLRDNMLSYFSLKWETNEWKEEMRDDFIISLYYTRCIYKLSSEETKS